MALLRELTRPAALSPNDERVWSTYQGPPSIAGPRVSADTSMRISAVYRCTTLLSGAIGGLPLPVYKRSDDDSRQRDRGHAVYRLMNQRPNRWQTPMTFRGTLTSHALLRGNGFARVVDADRDGEPEELLPLHPDQVRPEQLDDGTPRYVVTKRNGTEEVLTQDEVFHLVGLSLDGFQGVSVVSAAREAFGLGLAYDQYAAAFFGRGSRPGGVLEVAGKLGVDGLRRARAQFEQFHRGLDNAFRVAVLEEGQKFTPVMMSAKDSEFVAQRAHSVEDICRWFGVPPHMVGSTTKETTWGSGIEQMSIAFVVYTLRFWLIQWEQTIQRDLMLDEDTFYAEHLVDALLRGDSKQRAEALQMMRQNGVLLGNEWRRIENLNPLPDGVGDVAWMPANMRDAAAPPPEPEPQRDLPAAPAPPAPADEEDEDAGAARGRAHYRALLHDAASGIVRREVAAVTKAAQRHAGDPAAWRQALDEFYADHAAHVAARLRVPRVAAEVYVDGQRIQLERLGAAAAEEWETTHLVELLAIVERHTEGVA